ncbi:hypothetical protein QTP88_001278 [Uroleucon formosanum]
MPPTLTGQECLEQLKAGQELAWRVSGELCESNPEINRRAWTNYGFRCLMKGRGICMRRIEQNRRMILLLATVQGQLPYTVEEFKNQTLMYCENGGSIRVTGASWEILTYVPLKNYDDRHDKLYNELDTMTNHCKETITGYEICSRKRSHKFVIMDFEFSMMNKTSMVLISGAISNSLDKCKVRKLEGRPPLLPLHEVLRQMKTHELLLAKKEIKRIFKCKEILQVACLKQLDKSLNSTLNNLNPTFIENYISNGIKTNVVVLWNGSSDLNILKRMNINRFPVLNITCYDTKFNGNFSILLENLKTKVNIFEYEIGDNFVVLMLLNLYPTHLFAATFFFDETIELLWFGKQEIVLISLIISG